MSRQIVGPFAELVTMRNLPKSGPIRDEQLEVISNSGVAIRDGIIEEIGNFETIRRPDDQITELPSPTVALPGLIDAHTHICYAGSRSGDYALRLSGHTYQEIAAKGGGILDTVKKTREASKEELVELTVNRAKQLALRGVTTCEVKSGYGLTIDSEIKILEAIHEANLQQPVDLIPTCLAAHTKPKEYSLPSDYLKDLQADLFPLLKKKNLTNRIDIFVEQGAFSPEEARPYLLAAKEAGFTLVLHADQFSLGGADLAAEVGALSADHLEESDETVFSQLKKGNVIPVMLPGATLGLGLPFPKARKALDADLPLVIASDWNPGSAPMGDLLIQAALLGAEQKLSMAETLAAITARAALALNKTDRGILAPGMRADLALYPCKQYQEILYSQGTLGPFRVFIKGVSTDGCSHKNKNHS